MKPFLLIDVDGPLNPVMSISQARARGYDRHMLNPMMADGSMWRDAHGMKLRVFLNRAHGEGLLKLTDVFDLVWATTWEHEANMLIGPRIGLPKLPVIEFDRSWRLPTRPDGTYFKTHDVVRYVNGRSFAWVDDEVSEHDEEYVAEHHTGPALLCDVSPLTGLTGEHFAKLREWAEEINPLTGK